jgi:peptidoglycan/xylan/chitin deacetylase (PgdA/CDA1 family)
MTWDQVKALRTAGMDVQSHTSTHRVLQTVPEEELLSELGSAREVLEGVLGEPVRAISYPVGKPLRYTPHIRNAVRAAGYELGFSNGTGVNHRWDFDPLDARRISLDVSLSDAFFRAMMALPYLAY